MWILVDPRRKTLERISLPETIFPEHVQLNGGPCGFLHFVGVSIVCFADEHGNITDRNGGAMKGVAPSRTSGMIGRFPA
jgi:hypothetical protein